MTRAVEHRGPDGVGFLHRENVSLGHRRLAIIDPQLGQQPMSNEDESVWITCNGEIYNYRELKAELRQQGHRFVTNSDTELVIHAYEEWGIDCVQKFRGMFAFGIADFRKRRLFLARDRFGIKPLYYRTNNSYLAFASELAALLEIEDVTPGGNLLAIELYLRYQYIPTPHTIYRDVYKLPPGTHLLVDFDDDDKPLPQPVRYWRLAFNPDADKPDAEWINEAEQIIHDSVRSHLVADVPFGVLLSGGVDSSLVAIEMSRILKRPFSAFAIGFHEPKYSELEFAKQVASLCGIQLHTKIVEDDLTFLPDLISHYGEPFGDSSAVATWHVSRLAREHVPMVLSGDGGDEAFGGYSSYEQWMKIRPFPQGLKKFWISPRTSAYLARRSIHHRLFHGTWHDLPLWQQIVGDLNKESRQDLWKAVHQSLINQRCEVFDDAATEARGYDRLAFAQYLDYQTYLPCDILTKVDVASMFHGLEVRTPLVDSLVVDLATRLPLRQRFRQNGSDQPIGKYLTKKILEKTLPKEFVHRRKQGFSIPISSWFQPRRKSRELIEDVISSHSSRLNEFFHLDKVARMLELHNDKVDNSSTLWLLLILGIWFQQNPRVSFT